MSAAEGPGNLASRLATALDDASGATAEIADLRRLTGGANMETWSFDLARAGQAEPLILRRLPGGLYAGQIAPVGGTGELDLADEAALIALAGRYGVPVPRVRLVLGADHGLGLGYVMSREEGEALPFRLLGDDRYRGARERLAFQCGEALGRIHRIPLPSLPQGLPDHSGELLLTRAQFLLDAHGDVSPVLQLGLNWLREHARPAPKRALVHGDFRLGNLLLDDTGLVAVLDWELAHLGDPVQDLGNLTANVWRFGAPGPVAGCGDYVDLLAGYASVTGAAPALADIHYWQTYAALSWGMVCLIMLEMYRSGRDSSLERAAVGRRLSEAEIDLLLLLDGASP